MFHRDAPLELEPVTAGLTNFGAGGARAKIVVAPLIPEPRLSSNNISTR
jgi:hypothetical protein